ncbi:MAG TPA: lanthionine synthetase C family protein [Thermoanaerobaculia bacterium]|nr:lanthionine synthetase C family protein [Thermoanaerobaculia bacterium]
MSADSTSWRPLLEGQLAVRAADAVRAIAGALADLGRDDGQSPAAMYAAGWSVSGAAGRALFFGYLARSLETDAARYSEEADQLLERTTEALATTPMGPALYSGFTGIAWVAEHLGKILAVEEPGAGDDPGEEIDEVLLLALASPWTGNYDLISGLVGFGVYALERVPRLTAIRCVEAIVDRLDETAEKTGEGITWFTSPDLLPPANRELHPKGYFNLGVAHGVPGVIVFLAEACRLEIRSETARPLLEGAVRWVLAHRLANQRGACYPAWVLPGIEPQPSRLAWCYGDPGVAVSLLCAARAVGVAEWERAALDIAIHAAGAAQEDAGVRDAGLCHGALGLAHLYNRIYQAGGGERFADAARLWYSAGLDMRRPEGGIAGFEAWVLGAHREMVWAADPGFLTGAAGVGLALLAGLTSIEPEWDRLLMAAVPDLSKNAVE